MSNEAPTSLSDEKSKSQVKRELDVLKELGGQLVDLPVRQLQLIPMDDTTRSAITDAYTLKKGAMKRQLRYIGGLLKEEDVAALRGTLDDLMLPQRLQVRELHEAEQWRDALIAGEDAVLSELAGRFIDLDRQRLMQLVRKARKELEQEKTPKAARAIFQYLKDLQAPI